MKLRYYIKTFRLRTLPLSISGILLGSFLTFKSGAFSPKIFILALATVLFLQILSNIANELGDTIHGTDTDDRQGPQYLLQSGILTVKDFFLLIVFFIFLSCVSGIALVASSFDVLFSKDGLLMIVLGAFAVLAALFYTLGKHPYGYSGFGDIMVFIFFGLASTLGSNFLMTGSIDMKILLPASACGLLSVGVLNINNIRDMSTDKKNRITVPILIGEQMAKVYQLFLEVVPFILMIIYCAINHSSWKSYVFLFMLPFFVRHLYFVFRFSNKDLDPLLPQLSKMTFVFCLLSALGDLATVFCK